MRALVQRVSQAEVRIDGEIVGATGPGLMILICAMANDTAEVSAKLASKIAKLRIFRDESGRMNKSVCDVSGSALVVSQFTLAADTHRGNRPGFSAAAAPALGEELYQRFCEDLRAAGVPAETGQFGADMAVSLTNDGPVTIWLDTADN